jgi:23S rRNA pseudouridine955/2504/2580 synthase
LALKYKKMWKTRVVRLTGWKAVDYSGKKCRQLSSTKFSTMNVQNEIIADRNDKDMRLDKFIISHYPAANKAVIEKLIRKKAIKVNGKKEDSSYKMKSGDAVFIPEMIKALEKRTPEKQKVHIDHKDSDRFYAKHLIYADSNLVVINKPEGLSTQGGSKVKISVDDYLQYAPRTLHNVKTGELRLTHRLDKDTSGILLIAQSENAARVLTEMFKKKTIYKTYLALCVNLPENKAGSISAPILAKAGGKVEKSVVDEEGKPAITDYEVIDNVSTTASLLRLEPKTGRTHQIRVHMNHIGCPVLSDGKYGGADCFIKGTSNKMHLHAHQIEFTAFGKKYNFSAPIPTHFKESMDFLGLSEK